jgi:hypothetical protein
VRRLRSPVRLEAEPGLEGCRSLVTLSKPLEIPLGAPAAADFTQRWQEIRDRLLDRNGEPAVGG